MKTISASLKALVVASLACAAGFAAAADTQTVAVNASVAAVCKFSTAAAAIDFGAINQSAGSGNKTAPVSVPFKCTKGVTPVITQGTIVPLTSGSNTMAFTVPAFTIPVATGFSAAVNATSTATIAQAVWQDAPAGTYAGSIVLDINN
ncbi:hypothetical protein [Polaromonas sp.]|uniref:hypothetical protein n=1 Tax=Polaromonas sp. TaxID=1869339 RepID=UPI001D969A74|nr:hypothetical protein [Polaromonas sp.]MBT9477154.1 hypothetical protein [Polaromonas sp.]